MIVTVLLLARPLPGADWTEFRGPGGRATSEATGLPAKWTEVENIVWRTKLPGPGTSSPITLGDRIYVTSYSGYGLAPNEGDMNDLRRHVVCVDRTSGKILWDRQFEPRLPESKYSGGNSSRHGYSSSTPTTDGERLYVFFGKSGVYCLDLDGKEVWNTTVGSDTHGWGSSNSPVLFEDLVIVNASVESQSLVALNKRSGEEVWRTEGIRRSWNTPVLVDVPGGQTELVVSETENVLGLDPRTGEELWRVTGFDGYVCPSVVAHDGIVYVVRGSSLAIRAGGPRPFGGPLAALLPGTHLLDRPRHRSLSRRQVRRTGFSGAPRAGRGSRVFVDHRGRRQTLLPFAIQRHVCAGRQPGISVAVPQCVPGRRQPHQCFADRLQWSAIAAHGSLSVLHRKRIAPPGSTRHDSVAGQDTAHRCSFQFVGIKRGRRDHARFTMERASVTAAFALLP
jgi:hypothetical protein